MRLQPNRDYVSNDNIQSPPALARRLVAHFNPTGCILEPCSGEGNFLRAPRAHARSLSKSVRRPKRSPFSSTPKARRNSSASELLTTRYSLPTTSTSVSWCEVQRGADFFAWNQPVDWIITNPLWSQVRRFLQHAMAHADHVVLVPEYTPFLD